MMDPQQELFTALRLAIEAQGYGVYDGGLPPDGTPYPFVYLADSRQHDQQNKSAIFGTVYQTVHVWHSNPRQRGTVSEILADIKAVARELHDTKYFAWCVSNVEQRILADNSTRTPLLHGVLELEFRFSGR